MTLPVTNYGAPVFQPGISADSFTPDQLVADPRTLVSRDRTITGGAVYKRGTVLGVITATGKYTISLAAAADGSEDPVEILADDVDTTGGDQNGGTYVSGEFNANAVILGTGQTLTGVTAALEAKKIFLRTPVSATDPS